MIKTIFLIINHTIFSFMLSWKLTNGFYHLFLAAKDVLYHNIRPRKLAYKDSCFWDNIKVWDRAEPVFSFYRGIMVGRATLQ